VIIIELVYWNYICLIKEGDYEARNLNHHIEFTNRLWKGEIIVLDETLKLNHQNKISTQFKWGKSLGICSVIPRIFLSGEDSMNLSYMNEIVCIETESRDIKRSVGLGQITESSPMQSSPQSILNTPSFPFHSLSFLLSSSPAFPSLFFICCVTFFSHPYSLILYISPKHKVTETINCVSSLWIFIKWLVNVAFFFTMD